VDFEVVCGGVGGEVRGYAAHCGDVEVEGKKRGKGEGYGGEGWSVTVGVFADGRCQ